MECLAVLRVDSHLAFGQSDRSFAITVACSPESGHVLAGPADSIPVGGIAVWVKAEADVRIGTVSRPNPPGPRKLSPNRVGPTALNTSSASTAAPSAPEPPARSTGAVSVMRTPSYSIGLYGYRSFRPSVQGFPCCHLVSSTDSLAFGPDARPSSSLCPDRHQALEPTATGRRRSVVEERPPHSTRFPRPSSSNSSRTVGGRTPPSPPPSGCRRRRFGSGWPGWSAPAWCRSSL